jgi:hypothetical protein
VGTSGRGEDIRVNMVEIFCTHVCKWKNDNCLKIFQEWRRDDKAE